MSAICCAEVPFAQCETVAISLDSRSEPITTVALGDTIQLSALNTDGYVVESDGVPGYIPLTVSGVGLTCVTLSLVTDAAVYYLQSAPTAPQVVINVHITRGASEPDVWSQTITYTAPVVVSSLHYAAGATHLTVDLVPGTYRCFGEITVGSALAGARAAIHARLDVTAIREV